MILKYKNIEIKLNIKLKKYSSFIQMTKFKPLDLI